MTASEVLRKYHLPEVGLEAISVAADDPDVAKAARIYREYGCLAVRGLMKPYLADLNRDIEAAARESLDLLPEAKKITEGWHTPNGTLFLPAPANYGREQQIMVLGLNYMNSAAFFRTAFDNHCVDIVAAILGPNVELFGNGQCLYKEPVGGHPKHLHQDAAYFQHHSEGPVAILNYAVDTDLVNGALHVVPGSHKLGVLPHIDTFSHLGLDSAEWPWEAAVPVVAEAGTSIFFNVNTIHGSKENFSDKARPVFINRYRRIDDFTTIGGTTVANRAENAKNAQANPPPKKPAGQKNLMVRGFRPW
jgi:phytanoyl-CoA hydroxylase